MRYQKALYGGMLDLPPAKVECYVLDNRMRVITEAGLADMLLLSDGPIERAMEHIMSLRTTSRFAQLEDFRFTTEAFLAGGNVLHGAESSTVVTLLYAIRFGVSDGPLNYPMIRERAEQLTELLLRKGLVNLIDRACNAWHLRTPTDLRDMFNASFTG